MHWQAKLANKHPRSWWSPTWYHGGVSILCLSLSLCPFSLIKAVVWWVMADEQISEMYKPNHTEGSGIFKKLITQDLYFWALIYIEQIQWVERVCPVSLSVPVLSFLIFALFSCCLTCLLSLQTAEKISWTQFALSFRWNDWLSSYQFRAKFIRNIFFSVLPAIE